jgi:hypothetical protein
MSVRFLRRARRRVVLLAGTVVVAVFAVVNGALIAHARSANPRLAACVPYSTGRVPASTRCMVLPWQLLEAGPGGRSIEVTTAPDCFGNRHGDVVAPKATVQETPSAIDVRLVVRGIPTLKHGRLAKGCVLAQKTIPLRKPIDGREVEGASWPTHPRFGGLGHWTTLPRLLGLAPDQAQHTLWLEGFRSQLIGHGKQVISQLPGWGLSDRSGQGPLALPKQGALLTAGDRLAIPTRPAITPGSPTGTVVATGKRGSGAGPKPVAVFDSSGRLLARISLPGQRPLRVELMPGRYLLLPDYFESSTCIPAHVRVQAGQTTNVTLPFDCEIA